MTRILIVEDNPTLVRALERTIIKRAPEFSVVTSRDGLEATELLEKEAFDFVITDLRMPRMDGFELLAWLIAHRPCLPVLAITGYAGEATLTRLSDLGGFECFTKPIDVRGLIARVRETLAQSIRGHVEHVSLASFLQLIEMERKTCTLTVESDGQKGVIFIRMGQLIDARTENLTGTEAAICIVAWSDPDINIVSRCEAQERKIERPLGFIIMEGLRLKDESARHQVTSDCAEIISASTPTEHNQIARVGLSAASSGAGAPELPTGARALSFVDTLTGNIQSWASRDGVPLAALATVSAVVLRLEIATLESFGESKHLEEVVLTTANECYVIRPVGAGCDRFVLLVFSRDEMSLVMARIHLDRLLACYPSALSERRTFLVEPAE